jgi:uncharacterized membrane protein/thiol-disulfide isomerase/thioredoxin
MKTKFCRTSLSSALFTLLFVLAFPAQAEVPIVHAILFYSPSCPHCHQVINDALPPLLEKYPDQLEIVGINTYTEQGHALYEAVVNTYQVPPERLGVPTMIVGETVLVGSLEIPEQFPAIIKEGLANGGIDWPDIPEVQTLLVNERISDSDQPSESEKSDDRADNKPVYEDDDIADADEGTDTAKVSEEAIFSEKESLKIQSSLENAAFAVDQSTMKERFLRDKTGNTISVIVLFGMIFSVVSVSTNVLHSSINLIPWPNWTVPVLVLIGICVATYMGYVEVTQTDAVCGPVGDCNTVQQSSYASLFGIIPIGILGIAGYFLIGITWLFAIKGPAKWKTLSTLGLWLLSLFGALFSIYLTFLEPFVIGATCAWCLTSAVIMHLLLWSTTAPAMAVWKERK